MFKLMLVDDEPSILHGIARMIRSRTSQQIEILLADSAAQALSLCAEQCPDLVVTDIYMPEMDGFELIEAITARYACRRFAILSGYNDFELARRALHVKTLEYLTKPVNVQELLTLLDTVVHDVAEEQRMQHKQLASALRNALLYGLVPYAAAHTSTVLDAWLALPFAAVVVLEAPYPCDRIFEFLDPVRPLFDQTHVFELAQEDRAVLIGATARPCDDVALLKALQSQQNRIAQSSVGLAVGRNRWEDLQALYQQSLKNASYDAFFRGVSGMSATLCAPIEMAKAYLNAHYKEDVSLERLAGAVRLHPNYLSSLFKKETGLSFRQYLHQYRIMIATKQIVQHPEISFEVLALEVGYENPRQFFKMFKEYAGLTPGQYRLRMLDRKEGKA